MQRPDALLTEKKDKRADWMSSIENEQSQVKEDNKKKLANTVTELTQTVADLKAYISKVEQNSGVSEDKIKEILQHSYNQPKPDEVTNIPVEQPSQADRNKKKSVDLANIADIDLLPPHPPLKVIIKTIIVYIQTMLLIGKKSQLFIHS